MPFAIAISLAIYKRFTKNPITPPEGMYPFLTMGIVLWPVVLVCGTFAALIIGLYRLIGGPFNSEN